MSIDDGSVVERRSVLTSPLALLVIGLAAMWVVEIVDAIVFDGALDGNGLRPRHRDGLDGILWAPFLHADFGHLVSNTVPFLVLGGLVALRGLRAWAIVTVTVIVLGGALTWLFGSSGIHIGASGVVFGYFGAIIGAAVFERRLGALVAAAIALVLYSGIVRGLVPQDAISWEGHLFGLIGGVVAAKALAAEQRDDPVSSLSP